MLALRGGGQRHKHSPANTCQTSSLDRPAGHTAGDPRYLCSQQSRGRRFADVPTCLCWNTRKRVL